MGRAIVKEKKALDKEKKWILDEVVYLKKFREDVEEIRTLKDKVQLIGSLKNFKKQDQHLQELLDLIEVDKHKFRGLRRRLGRDERRRMRFEKKVFRHLKGLEELEDQPTQLEIKKIVASVHVFSARVLSELSWRTGRVWQVIRKEPTDFDLLVKHFSSIKEACTALLALFVQLENVLNKIDRVMHKQKLLSDVDISGLNNYLSDGVIKTNFLRSFPDLWDFLVSGKCSEMNARWGAEAEFYELISKYESDLQKYFDSKALMQLRNIRYPISKRGVLLFLPGIEHPLQAFNINNIPDFKMPGWLFHARGGAGLRRISKAGVLTSPLEMIHQLKKYTSQKYKRDPREKRLLDGISFGFQDYNKWLIYTNSDSAEGKGKRGGFFIFPLTDVLNEGLILDFEETIDGYPEIVLQDRKYDTESAVLVKRLLHSIETLGKWLRSYDDLAVFFSQAKKHIELLQRMGNELKEKEVYSVHSYGGEFVFGVKMDMKRPIGINKSAREMLKTGVIERRNKLWDELKQLKDRYWKKQEQAKTITKLIERKEKQKKFLDQIIAKAQSKSYHQGIKEQGMFNGRGPFYEILAKAYLKKDFFSKMVVFLEEGKFLQASLFQDYIRFQTNFEDKDFQIPLARFSTQNRPNYFDGTILQQGLDYYNEEKQTGFNFTLHCIELTYLSQYNLVNKNQTVAIEKLKRLPPHTIHKWVKKTIREQLKILEKAIPKRYRSAKPCTVDIKKGLLCISTHMKNEKLVNRLVREGQPMITEFGDSTNDFPGKQLDVIFENVVPLHTLQGGRGYNDDDSYFFKKNNQLWVHRRKRNKDEMVM